MKVKRYEASEKQFITQTLHAGIAHQNAGDLHLAWAAYRQVLELFPDQADALNLMGVVASEMGDLRRAIHLFEGAIRADARISGFHLNLGNAYVRGGDLPKAARSYERALDLDPLNAEAQRQLGFLVLRRGEPRDGLKRLQRAFMLAPSPDVAVNMIDTLLSLGFKEEAVALATRCIKVLPDAAAVYYALGNAHSTRGDWPGAVEAYESALSLRAQYPEALVNLARARRALGDNAGAMPLYKRAVELAPELAEAQLNFGIALREAGDRAGARLAYEAAVRARPNWAPARFNLANLLREERDFDGAITQYREVVKTDPTFLYAWVNLGNALRARRKLDEAMQCYETALTLDAACVEARINIGNVLRDQERPEAAAAAYRYVVDMNPDIPQAHNNLGVALRESGRITGARAACERAVALAPSYADAHYNLGTTFADEGDAGRAVANYRRALTLDPLLIEARSNLMMTSHYDMGQDITALSALHREYDIVHARGLRREKPAKRTSGKLRVGYVSSDYRRHSVAYFAEPVLAHHDRTRFEVVCYHNHITEDDVTERFKGHAQTWVNCVGMSDNELAERIRGDAVDILIDLNGHTGGNRLLVFARNPAPVQMSWLGYPGTTGLSSMDYRITDWQVDPRGYEAYNSEKPLRLPGSYFCYQPPAEAPAVGALPMRANGQVTFGSFNNLAKLSDATVKMWSRVLKSVEGSRLLLKTKALADEGVRARVQERFAREGIAAKRLELISWEAHTTHHLEIYNRVDIALDTWPYNGATTTCEALWMGVPVVSLTGPMHASRMGLSILRSAGLVAHAEYDADGFVERCATLARDQSRLMRFRETARERLRQSRLLDAEEFTRNFELLLTSAAGEGGGQPFPEEIVPAQ